VTQLKAVLQACEELWPAAGAEAWDAPGLLVGSSSQRVSKVLLTVDVTNEVVQEAIDGNFDAIIAHHPFLLKGIQNLSGEQAKGATLTKAIKHEIAIFSAHTNADIVPTGVSDVLASKIGIVFPLPLVETQRGIGHGRIGNLPKAVTLGDFAKSLAKVLPATAGGVRVAGDYHQQISKVAVCGGAGDSFISQALAQGADVYVTSDLRHHVVQDAREQVNLAKTGPAIIDISHWAAEWLWLGVACDQLRQIVPTVKFEVCDLRTDPWDFIVTQ